MPRRQATARQDARALKAPAAAVALLAASLPPAHAAETAAPSLPPAATAPVDFVRDIQPIFESACYSCHSGERPKSGYRMTDRESTIRGGKLGAAVVPGDSAASPLIRYVAGLVPDLEMPPAGKGEPLTREQIAQLRAWVDQGAPYPAGSGAPEPSAQMTATAALRWISVTGDQAKFRELNWLPQGFSGGVDDFAWQQPVGRDGVFTAEGHAYFGAEDYAVKLAYDQRDLGFVRGGYTQFRKWYDGTGGYYEPFGVPPYSLGGDLHVDNGRAWIEAGLNKPGLPQLTLGYEYLFRQGDRSTLQWGTVYDPAIDVARAIYPAVEQIDQQVQVVRFDFGYNVAGVDIADNFRGEFTDLRSTRLNSDYFTMGSAVPDAASRYQNSFNYFEGANTLRLEKPVKDWLLLSGGYLYSNLNGDAGFSGDYLTPGDPSSGITPGDYANEIILRRESNVLNANAQFTPWKTFAFAAGAQADWTRQEGFGNALLYGLPSGLDANLARTAVSEYASVRYTGLPLSVLYAETRLQQESLGQAEQALAADPDTGIGGFQRNTDATTRLWDGRVGATVSPVTTLSLDASYRYRARNTDFDNTQNWDFAANPDASGPAFITVPGTGYPAFILARDLEANEAAFRVAWQTARWLKTTFKYQYITSTIATETGPVTDPVSSTTTPGGWLNSGQYTANIYSLNATLTPWRRLYFNTTFAYSQTRSVSGLDTASVVPYEGPIYTLMPSATYALDAKTDLSATYSFSKADYQQDNYAAGLPLGISYGRHSLLAGVKRRLAKDFTVSLQYAFFLYNEPTSDGATDYTGQGVFGFVTKRLR